MRDSRPDDDVLGEDTVLHVYLIELNGYFKLLFVLARARKPHFVALSVGLNLGDRMSDIQQGLVYADGYEGVRTDG